MSRLHDVAPLPIEYDETASIYAKTVAKDHRTILFTSADRGEGVSTIAYAIAQKAAASGRRTLLMEFNTYRPFLNGVLQLPTSDWRLDQLDIERDIFTVSGTKLSFLPAPHRQSFPVETRKPEIIQEALASMLEDYDLVIADAPCLCRPNLNGIPTKMLAAHFASTVLVVASNKTSSNLIARAVEQLVDAEICLAGAVLNDQIYPSLFKELERQFSKAGGIGRKIWSLVAPRLRQASFMTDSF
ncbi:tyrosine-protein kinase family protein [Aestuariispira insulae]|uniref:Capsular exopolysaccharide synthesis family protein n=1 Tax=Aestuariispira insulae TaxID=1461337 RepID=A0A3D9H3L7_9PROT|nr:tyrosine-protein kinase family protein [Aestuariispira insulae]RED43801.1 hypothetical protein DFP90_11824 [Aestuariispira insulae]